MKKTFRSILVGLLVVPALAFAQFSADVSGGGGSNATKLDIKQTGPGAAELTFTGIKLVYLNHDPKIAGVTAKKDVSKKGDVWIVGPDATGLTGLEVCLSGIGRGGWAVVDGKVDKTKTKCAPAAATVKLAITVEGTGQCFGVTPLAIQNDVVVKDVWVSHANGQTKKLVKRADGKTDMVTVLCVDGSGKIAPPTDAQAKEYVKTYLAVTAVE